MEDTALSVKMLQIQHSCKAYHKMLTPEMAYLTLSQGTNETEQVKGCTAWPAFNPGP